MILSAVQSSAQTTSTVRLDSTIVLTGVIKKFVSKNHKVDTCNDEFGNRYICKIDGRKWFGSDQVLDLPRNQLISLSIKLKNVSIPLNVEGMFNPSHGFLKKRQFKLKKLKAGYILYAFFSDGAATYTVYWKIDKEKSRRVKISNDEADFQWQDIK